MHVALQVRGRLVHLETACFLSSVDPDILLAVRSGVGELLPGSSDDFPLKRGVTNVSDFTIFAEFLRDGTRISFLRGRAPGIQPQVARCGSCLAILRMHTRLRLQPAPLALVARTLYENLGLYGRVRTHRDMVAIRTRSCNPHAGVCEADSRLGGTLWAVRGDVEKLRSGANSPASVSAASVP
ncbi:hypothetical protein BD779DRAFT_1471389 [Infundibulicybe gibba]|nr:hypothetical protein BD779DRAFT_1471389 [Infundibulicybe gibba]